jgi:CubicO group peptidase (beta-lactamase class C family)
MTRRSVLLQGLLLAVKSGAPEKAFALLEEQTKSGQVTGAALLIQSKSFKVARAFGKAKDVKAVFLLASITKPMTASAVMLLVDRGQLSLTAPVQKFIPEFRGDGRERVLVRHLLTHTSGLPDMLPNDEELRKRHAPLSEFVEGACRTPLLFSPGSELRYQSMGILLASEIVRRITQVPFADFVQSRIYKPLGMSETLLGLGGRPLASTMPSQVTQPSDWDWNSAYWRNLASPWGGSLSTVGDVGKFLQYFAHPGHKLLKPETAAQMVTNQTTGLNKSWGLGWMLNNGQFGSGCSPTTFGHSGSTGTLCWFDPQKELSFVLLTTKPAAQSSKTLLQPVSEDVSTHATT